jgi:hypothetical protein
MSLLSGSNFDICVMSGVRLSRRASAAIYAEALQIFSASQLWPAANVLIELKQNVAQ